MHKCKRKNCAYMAKFSGGSITYCDYIGFTGHARGCDADKCDKYIKKSAKNAPKRPKWEL